MHLDKDCIEMTKHISLAIALTVTTFLSAPAIAASLTPTLDNLKSEAGIVLPTLNETYKLTKLINNELPPEGAAVVTVGDKIYYFVPNGEYADLLVALAGTLKENENGLFELDGKKYGFDTASTPTSVFSYQKANADDYDFAIREGDQKGEVVTQYYKLNFNSVEPQKFDRISWKKVSAADKDKENVVAFRLSDDDIRYYQFSYQQPDSFETVADKTQHTEVTNPAGTISSITIKAGGAAFYNDGDYDTLDNRVFSNNRVSADVANTQDTYRHYMLQGGAVYNSGTISQINSDFIDNSVIINKSGEKLTVFPQGGAIFNKGKIKNISGNFIRNQGSAVYNFGFRAEAVIDSISGNFIENTESAIVNRADNQGLDGNSADNTAIIGSISGNFFNNTGYDGGAIDNLSFHGTARIDKIDGMFVGNQVSGNGGAVYKVGYAFAEGDLFNQINGVFINNSADGRGGAIYGNAGNIQASFINNNAQEGGAIYAVSDIFSLKGDFIGNSATGRGGAIWNDHGTIYDLTGDFINNQSGSMAGAIGVDQAYFGNITGNFIGNTAPLAGAILNTPNSSIGTINGNFYNNGAIDNGVETGMPGIAGGAIINISPIDRIQGDFSGNYAKSNTVGGGGAIFNISPINRLNSSFVHNYVEAKTVAAGGAIADLGVLGLMFGSGASSYSLTVNGSFVGNYVQATDGVATGGAMAALPGYAVSDDGKSNALAPFKIQAQNKDILFSGNYSVDSRGKIYNAISVVQLPDTLTGLLQMIIGVDFNNDYNAIEFDTTGGGSVTINDTIDTSEFNLGLDSFSVSMQQNYSKAYDMVLKGDAAFDEFGLSEQYVAVNNDIIHAGKVNVSGTTLRFDAYQHQDQNALNWDGKGAFRPGKGTDAVTSLSLNNAAFDIANGYTETVKLKGYASNDSYLHIDIDPDNMTADVLDINGDVEGQTKLVVYSSSPTDIRGKGSVLFAQSENDSAGNADSFSIFRVYGSPYMYEIAHTQSGEKQNQWALTMGEVVNPDENVKPVKPGQPDVPEVPDVPTPPTPELPDIPVKPTPSVDYRKVAPEVIAYQGLPAAALEQTKGMVGNVSGQITRTDADHTLWANAVYRTSENEALVNVDADVWGIEAGGDLQHDLNNKLGLFLSYRKGNYDMSGDGKHHYSTVGSQIDIDSYLAGLYYRYDRNHWWTFATVYGGIQRVDLKTKDGIKSDTDGTEFGGSVELGYDYAINKTVYLTPSVGAFYTQVDYDDATDSAGKIAKYNTLRQLELEAGVKLTKAFVTDEGYANVYVKPSVVRTITDGDEVRITGLNKVNTLDDQTLGRVELGGRYGFTEQLSAYGWANHTFGDDYKASTFGLGLSYRW